MSDSSTEKKEKSGKRKPWRFMDRWRIEGCLFTESPLHVGNGKVFPHPTVLVDDKPVDVTAVMKDHNGWPILPGSSVKGCLRDWVDRRMKENSPELIQDVFGKAIGTTTKPRETAGEVLIEGGRAVFHDSPLVVPRTDETPLPSWDPCAQTYIETNNSIDRHTRTAADNHLFYTECIPAGVGFHLEITGNFNEEQASLILYALNGFNAGHDPITIGADTENGKGRCRWEQGRIYRMDQQATVRWMKSANRNLAEKDMPKLSSQEVASLRKSAICDHRERYCKEAIRIDVTLSFQSHFLVNDPPLKPKGVLKKKDSSDPDFRPLVDEMNNVILPAKSFRGAFRSQAEKILRTLGVKCCDIGSPCSKGIKHVDQVNDLCPACRIFGATGWASLLSISDFKLIPGDYEFTTQEFVAIDRFTGGGMDGAKFNAKAIYKPKFIGTLELDWERLRKINLSKGNSENWELALLALTLRDLKEGDITFGYGAAKGYGACIWETEGSIWEDPEFKENVNKSMDTFTKFIKDATSKSTPPASTGKGES